MAAGYEIVKLGGIMKNICCLGENGRYIFSEKYCTEL